MGVHPHAFGSNVLIVLLVSSVVMSCVSVPEGFDKKLRDPSFEHIGKALEAGCPSSGDGIQIEALAAGGGIPSLTLQGVWKGADFSIFQGEIVSPVGESLFTLDVNDATGVARTKASESLFTQGRKAEQMVDAIVKVGSKNLRSIVCGLHGLSRDEWVFVGRGGGVWLTRNSFGTGFTQLRFDSLVEWEGKAESRHLVITSEVFAGIFSKHVANLSWQGDEIRGKIRPRRLRLTSNDERYDLTLLEFD